MKKFEEAGMAAPRMLKNWSALHIHTEKSRSQVRYRLLAEHLDVTTIMHEDNPLNPHNMQS